jgi:hypothetical protein
MDAHETALRSLRSRITALLALKHTLALAAIWGFVLGLAVLVARAALRLDDVRVLLWGALGFVGALVAGASVALRRAPRLDVLRALVDQRLRAGGLLLASAEVDLAGWNDRLPPPLELRVRWRNPRSLAIFATASAFLAFAFLVPAPRRDEVSAGRLDVRRDLERLSGEIEVLEDEKVVSQDEARGLREGLASVEAGATASDPAKTWEALDHVAEKLRGAASAAAEEAVGATEKLSDAEAMSRALSAETGQKLLDAQSLAEAMAELASTLREAAGSERLSGKLSRRLERKLLDALDKASRRLAGDRRASPETEDALEVLRRERKDQAPGDLVARKAADGALRLFLPDGAVALAGVEDAAKASQLVVLTGEGRAPRVFRRQDDVAPVTADPKAFGAGEKVVALLGGGLPRVYSPSPRSVALGELDAVTEDAAVTCGPDEDARFWVFDPQATEACAGGASEDDLASLPEASSAAQASKEDLLRMLEALSRARLIDIETLERCRKAGACGDGELKEWLAKNGSGMQRGDFREAARSANRPGDGGVTRGRGDASLTWKDPSTKEGVSFREAVLPPGALGESGLVGVSLGEPGPGDAEPSRPLRPGALDKAAAGGGSAHTPVVLPRHRRAVQEYFERR